MEWGRDFIGEEITSITKRMNDLKRQIEKTKSIEEARLLEVKIRQLEARRDLYLMLIF